MDRTQTQRPDAVVPARQRALRVLLGVLVAYAALVATHEGEFWPFSIFPMFSQAGQPWSRAVVREVPPSEATQAWEPVPAEALPGEGYPLLEHGVDPIDLANFVSKTHVWTAERAQGLRRMFAADELEGRLVIYRALGELREAATVRVEYVPYVVLSQDTTILNPVLPRTSTDRVRAVR